MDLDRYQESSHARLVHCQRRGECRRPAAGPGQLYGRLPVYPRLSVEGGVVVGWEPGWAIIKAAPTQEARLSRQNGC